MLLSSTVRIFCRCRRRLSFLDITTAEGHDFLQTTRNPFIVNLSKAQYSKSHNPNDEDSSSDDEPQAKPKKEVSTAKTKTNLNSLLTSMVKDSPTSDLKSDEKAKRFSWFSDRKRKEKAEKPLPLDKEITKAAKDVAESLGGDVKKTESELLNKLLSRKEDGVEGDKRPEGEKKSINLSELIVGMKIDRTPVAEVSEKRMQRSQSQRLLAQARDTQREKQYYPETDRLKRKPSRMAPSKADLFGADPLGIFQKSHVGEENVRLRTWERLVERELRLAVTHPPANAFEEMILWTEKGLLWNFPIDNEQGMEEEMKVPFSDHIFLEHHLSPWCPTTGPIRHFMELVCVGLSKNPYIRAQEKVDHINWFKDYFNSKKDVLEMDDITLPPLDKEEPKRLE